MTILLRSLAIALLASLAGAAAAQSGIDVPLPPPPVARTVGLSAVAGFRTSSDVSATGGTIEIDGAPSYGVSLDVGAPWDSKVQVLWSYSGTNARVAPGSAFASDDFRLDVHYFQVGGLKYFGTERWKPWAAASIGAMLSVPGSVTLTTGEPVDASSLWRFAFTVGGGLDVALTPRLALRAQARLQAPVYFASATVWVGNATSGVAVDAGVPVLQGDFTAGLFYSF
jgi:opacity protein-like surface antigen